MLIGFSIDWTWIGVDYIIDFIRFEVFVKCVLCIVGFLTDVTRRAIGVTIGAVDLIRSAIAEYTADTAVKFGQYGIPDVIMFFDNTTRYAVCVTS